MSKAKPIPDGFHSVTPYLIVRDAAKAIEFYKEAFGASETLRLTQPGGKIGHAEIKIGDSHIMLADEAPEMDARSPQSVGGTPVSICLYVDDVDALIPTAVGAGARLVRPATDQFYGDRTAALEDPFGHKWHVATHQEDMTPAEMQTRFEAVMSQSSGAGK